MPPEEVTDLSGTVVSDLRPVGTAECFVLEIDRVGASDGTTTSGGGRLTVFLFGAASSGGGTCPEGGLRTGESSRSEETAEKLSCASPSCPAVLRRGERVCGKVSVRMEEENGTDGVGSRRIFASAVGGFCGLGWSSRLERWRSRGIEFVHDRLRSVGAPASGLLSALLLGIRGAESEGLFILFRRSGAVHLLALSGMHLGFLFLLSAGLCIPLFGRRMGLVLTLFGMVAYLLFVGFRPSLVRAVLMSGFGILWSLVSVRKIDTTRLLVFSLLLQSALMPADTHSLSFGLSYLALFGILTASGAVEHRIPFWIPPSVRSLLAAGITAQAFSAPLLFSVFGEVYPGGIISSVLLTPAVLLLMGGGIFYLIWSSVGFFTPGAAYVAADQLFRRGLRELAGLVEGMAEFFSRFPSIRSTGGGEFEVAILWGAVLTLFVMLHYGRIIVSIYRRRDAASTKPRLPRGDSAVSHGDGTCPVAPIWAELSRQSAGAQTNRRAA